MQAIEGHSRSTRDHHEEIKSSADGTFVLTVAMVQGSARDPLLVGACTLHRRGIAAVEAELRRPAPGRCIFRATFRASGRQAEIVLRTFAGQVDVLDADMVRVFEERESNDVFCPPARPAKAVGGAA